ncbi:MAG: transposase [Thaumarchaeota archaeon]|nr:transposase [Nitrososphaerota archaeon]
MNPSRCDDLDYIHFLVAAQRVFTCTEAARCQPDGEDRPAHDAFTRLLQRQPSDTEALWNEARAFVKLKGGLLILDDTTLDKPYSERMELVTYHWSGKHHRVVKGISLLSLLWTDGRKLVPSDFRLYDAPVSGLTKNDRFSEMLEKARERGFNPDYVLFDAWYSSLDNLKQVRELGWHFFTRLKENRLVSPDRGRNVPISSIEILPDWRIVYLKGFGFIKVFRTVPKDGDAEYWATDDLSMKGQRREELSHQGWGIEVYHRGIKQYCGVERTQVRKARAIISHILMSLRAFLRLEAYRLSRGISWYQAKANIIRDAMRTYLAHPIYLFNPTA